ncbi:MAG: UDP-3-O-(3-hydroxymyristoyl)glucosamine N-acyltransferase [Planctomycetota bacterium]
MSYTTQQIADRVGGTLFGPGDLAIRSLAEIDLAEPGQLTFIGDEKYADRWGACRASAVLVNRSIRLDRGEGRAIIAVDNADLAMAEVLAAFAPPTPRPELGVHPTAVIDPTATIGQGVRIGPYCVVHPHASIGDHTILHAGVNVFDHAVVGDGCELWTGTVIRDRCVLGDRCILHPHVVIGADGFGYRADLSGPSPRLVKVPQIGIVRVGNEVEIGANTTIDRAKFDATVLGDGCKIDNLVQIGHNCRLGPMVVIAASCAVGGSCVLGMGVQMGGRACIADHIRVGDRARVVGGAAVINEVPPGETWGGMPAKRMQVMWREEVAVRKLPGLLRRLKKMDIEI